MLDYKGVTALVLHWLACSVAQIDLQISFGLTPGACSEMLQRGRVALLAAFQKLPAAAVVWPSPEKMAENAERIMYGTREWPTLRAIPFGFVDGTVVRIARPAHEVLQRAFHSGKHSFHCVNNVFVFDPDGCIIWAAINHPGSWHDFKVSADLQSLLADPAQTPPGFGLIADIGFRSKSTKPMFITIHTQACKRPTHPVLLEDAIRADWWIAYKRQAVELGQRAFKSVSVKLRTLLPGDAGERANLLLMLVHLHNYRTRTVGGNQIKTVYQETLDARNRAEDAMEVTGDGSLLPPQSRRALALEPDSDDEEAEDEDAEFDEGPPSAHGAAGAGAGGSSCAVPDTSNYQQPPGVQFSLGLLAEVASGAPAGII